MSLTTLLLTNRLKINHDRIAKNIFNCYVFLIAFVAVLAVLGKCNHQDIPDVVYKARAFNAPIVYDTIRGKSTNGNKYVDVRAGNSNWINRTIYFKDGTISGFYFLDTTKPKQKVIYNHWKLEGNDTLFQMLWLQVQSPADVTPRNLQKLRDWLQSSIKIDSTNGK
jgi:hypothetical protein